VAENGRKQRSIFGRLRPANRAPLTDVPDGAESPRNAASRPGEQHPAGAAGAIKTPGGQRNGAHKHRADVSANRHDVRAVRREFRMSQPRLEEAVRSLVGDEVAQTDIAKLVDAMVARMHWHGVSSIPGRPRGEVSTVTFDDTLIDTYLSRSQVAELIGVKPASLSRYDLPEPDVAIGTGPRTVRGWRASTILTWHASRPFAGVNDATSSPGSTTP